MKKVAKHYWAVLIFMSSIPLLIGGVALRDPTEPPDYILNPADFAKQRWVVSAIFIRTNGSVAIIDDRVLRKGDQLNDFTITGIQPYTVELTGPENAKEVLQLLVPVKQQKY